MVKFLTFIVLLGATIFQGGCVRPPVLLSRVVVVNATNNTITDVKVLHLPTQKSGRVNAILAQKNLDIGFSSAPMLAHQAVVSWHDSDGFPHEVPLTLPKDNVAAKNGKIRELVYVIHPTDMVTVEFH